ncbi:PTS sugar transporter subunit IIA [Brachyspira hyodysenteriae]|uniref:PTS sugar transporter subunit IIA n=1 Tax=Brachyspira hyodysenteriae TaxID=159 RepID=UPI00063DD48B|nr:PTS glucose transporter subunit IIA [Brachyspira hyodysenteriae]KLI28923.1 PTS sugar transporter subunit IIA [Brachyspira hyodysenteriae]
MGLFSKKIEVKSPIKGKLVDVTEVKDEAFSTKALGDGMAIIPDEGKVYSPIDGEVITMVDSNHAIGFSSKGIEILIHIGMDTVKLKGKHFKAHVKEGDKVKVGTLLIEFDKEEVEKEYDITSPVIIPNFSELKSLTKTAPREVSLEDTIMTVVK